MNYELLVRLRSVGGRAVWTDADGVALYCGPERKPAFITWGDLELMVQDLEELDRNRLLNSN